MAQRVAETAVKWAAEARAAAAKIVGRAEVGEQVAKRAAQRVAETAAEGVAGAAETAAGSTQWNRPRCIDC